MLNANSNHNSPATASSSAGPSAPPPSLPEDSDVSVREGDADVVVTSAVGGGVPSAAYGKAGLIVPSSAAAGPCVSEAKIGAGVTVLVVSSSAAGAVAAEPEEGAGDTVTGKEVLAGATAALGAGVAVEADTFSWNTSAAKRGVPA